MANWNILQLDCYPEKDGESDVVFTAHWECTEIEGEYSGRAYGTVGLTLDPQAPFTPFPELTKEQVLGWIKGILGSETVAAHEDAVAQQIEDQKNPKVISLAPPWAAVLGPAPITE